MLDGVLSLIPGARVGFIGLYRNEETLEPVEYYVKLPARHRRARRDPARPDARDRQLDGGGGRDGEEAGASSVKLIALIAAPEGIERIQRDHPDVTIVVAAVDRGLNEKGTSFPASAMQATASTGRSRGR